MFGPCWLNFYGSPREFSELLDEYDDLNLGKVSIGQKLAYLVLFRLSFDVDGLPHNTEPRRHMELQISLS